MKPKNDLTAKPVRDLLDYDAVTGIFAWRVKRGNRPAGSVAGSPSHARGYVVIGIGGRKYLAHRLAHLCVTDEWPADEVDHRNGDTADNRWANLRSANRVQNGQNTVRNPGMTCRAPGVYWDARRGKWMARIRHDGQRLFLGRFDSDADAVRAYADARARLHVFAPERVWEPPTNWREVA